MEIKVNTFNDDIHVNSADYAAEGNQIARLSRIFMNDMLRLLAVMVQTLLAWLCGAQGSV
jgi:hypothetical protein